MNIYQEELMDHYRYPRNKGELESPDFCSELKNPSCGDEVQIKGMMRNGTIETVYFSGKGCVISQATASMVTEACKGKMADEVLLWGVSFIQGLVGISLGPVRLKCALLPLEALQQGLQAHR